MYVKEFIGNDYINWRDGQITILETPTGSGKTTFVEDVYRKYALASGKRILFCTNRTLLREQMLRRQDARICEEIEFLKSGPYNWKKSKRQELGNFEIVTYQSIENAVIWHNIKKMSYFLSFDILIMDEVHYLFTDSVFNTSTVLSFEFLIYNYRNRKIIMLSATLKNFYPLLATYLNQTAKESPLAIEGMYPAYTFERMEPDYSYLDFHWFHDDKDIAELVKNIPQGEKILIFVPSITEGKKIAGILQEAVSKKDIFLYCTQTCNNVRGKEVTEELVEKETFSMRILITTAVMDSGVNLIDDSIRHLFVLYDNYETFVQALGRKRIKHNEMVSLYIHARSQGYFEGRLAFMQYELSYINSMVNCFNYRRFNTKAAMDFYDPKKAEILRKFTGVFHYTYENPVFFVNWLAKARMENLCYEYEAIIKSFEHNGMDAFILYVAEHWLDIDLRGAVRSFVPQSYAKNITDFLATYKDITLDVEAFNRFREALMPMLHAADRNMFPKKTELSHWKKINAFLNRESIPFTIVFHPKLRGSDETRKYTIEPYK